MNRQLLLIALLATLACSIAVDRQAAGARAARLELAEAN